MNDNELYDSILRDLSDGKIQSLRKKSIADYFEMPTHATAAAILLSEWRGFVILEKTGERSGQFWRRIKGGSFEEFSDIITEASALIVAKTIDYANPFAKNAKREFFGQYATALKHARSKDFIQSALVFFAEKVTIPELSSRWNTVPECIAILDGIADFSGNELVVRDAAPGEFFRTPLPISETGVLVPHEPKAFLAFLHDVFPDDSVRKTALQTLSLGIANRGVRIFSVWVGRGANGKSLLAEIMRHVLGSRAVAIRGAALTRGNDGAKRFAASELAGATFAFAEEVVGALDVSECKRLTGGTTIRVERKGLDSFETARPGRSTYFPTTRRHSRLMTPRSLIA
jgi:phage/plasmid-associated DNA primase